MQDEIKSFIHSFIQFSEVAQNVEGIESVQLFCYPIPRNQHGVMDKVLDFHAKGLEFKPRLGKTFSH